MAEKFNPTTAQEFVGEDKELPTRDSLLDMFDEKQKTLQEDLLESEAKSGFKLDANEMMAKNSNEKELKSQIDTLGSEWKRFGGDKIDEAQAAVDALDFKSDASDHIQAKYALRDAKEAFYSNFSQEFNATDEVSLEARTETGELADEEEPENATEIGELTDAEWDELQSQRMDADEQRKKDHMPRDTETLFSDEGNAYEADDTSGKDSETDAAMSAAKEAAKNGDIANSEKIRKDMMDKARKSVESGRYVESDYEEASVALLAEMYGKSEDEIREAMNRAGQKESDASDTPEDTQEAGADDTPEDIQDRLDMYENRAFKPTEEHEAIFDQTREAIEDEETEPKGRIKRLLSRFSLHRSGVKRPSIMSRIKQDEAYRSYLRERANNKKTRVDEKVNKKVSRAEVREENRAARDEMDDEEDNQENDSDDGDTHENKEVYGREAYEEQREDIDHLIERAKRRINSGEKDKANVLYAAARERLASIEPLGENEVFYETFDDDFYEKINEFGENFEEETE